jgi:hypothetical protein
VVIAVVLNPEGFPPAKSLSEKEDRVYRCSKPELVNKNTFSRLSQ